MSNNPTSASASETDGQPLDTVTMRALAASTGLTLTAERLDAAAAFADAMRAELERLRAVPLDFVGTVVTALDAVAWIENGGRGSPFVNRSGHAT